MYTKYTGIILKKHPFGEADELLTIYTREAGKIRAKAVSSRKIKSRLGGYLQSLNEIQFETAGRGNLPTLISVRAETLNNYLRENLKKFAHALVGVETLYRITPDEEQNSKIYDALSAFLRELGKPQGGSYEVKKFQVLLLELCGYAMPAGRQVNEFLQEVLEREIKSNNFVETLNSDPNQRMTS